MSRNEMFLLLACAFALAIFANGPGPLLHPPVVTVESLLAPTQLSTQPGTLLADTTESPPAAHHP